MPASGGSAAGATSDRPPVVGSRRITRIGAQLAGPFRDRGEADAGRPPTHCPPFSPPSSVHRLRAVPVAASREPDHRAAGLAGVPGQLVRALGGRSVRPPPHRRGVGHPAARRLFVVGHLSQRLRVRARRDSPPPYSRSAPASHEVVRAGGRVRTPSRRMSSRAPVYLSVCAARASGSFAAAGVARISPQRRLGSAPTPVRHRPEPSVQVAAQAAASFLPGAESSARWDRAEVPRRGGSQ
jgi:hypothetical protein